jgi:DNA-binding CsgD family transcriptional regulator
MSAEKMLSIIAKTNHQVRSFESRHSCDFPFATGLAYPKRLAERSYSAKQRSPCHSRPGGNFVDISADDASRVIRLVREVCDRWDDPAAWRKHLLQGACRLLEGNVGIMVSDRSPGESAFGCPVVMSIVGVPPDQCASALHAVSQFEQRGYADCSKDLLPGMASLHGILNRQGWVTAARDQFTSASEYYPSQSYVKFRNQIGCDDYVISIRIVDVPRRPEAISIDRPFQAPRFGPREVELLRLLHDEIAPLIGVRLATEEHLCRDGLSRRLAETLTLLLEGQSEKEAASTLSLSARTVHDYVTMLYNHFQVSSRAELLAYFIRRQPVRRRPVGDVENPLQMGR